MTDWNNLEGLELRRAVHKLIGWKYERACDMWHAPDCILKKTHNCQCHEMPPIESSADISERVLDEECKKRGAAWNVANGCGFECHISMVTDVVGKTQVVSLVASTHGATPSLARARAIGQMLERDAK